MDEHLSQKRMRVREKDVPYMTAEWKRAIKNKRKYGQVCPKLRSPENWENKRKWGNLATKERRKAIKEYWERKTEEIKKTQNNSSKLLNPF